MCFHPNYVSGKCYAQQVLIISGSLPTISTMHRTIQILCAVYRKTKHYSQYFIFYSVFCCIQFIFNMNFTNCLNIQDNSDSVRISAGNGPDWVNHMYVQMLSRIWKPTVKIWIDNFLREQHLWMTYSSFVNIL